MTIAAMSLVGKVAAITGGNRGIGRATAELFAEAGATVAIGSRHPADATEVLAQIKSQGGVAAAFRCDLSEPESLAQFAREAEDAFGVVDIVVANAGTSGENRPMHELTLEQWRACISVDLDGVFLTFKAFLPSLLRRGTGGSLIAIGSITGKRPLNGRTPYAAAKMGVIGLVRTLAVEVGPAGIRVNVISPGPVDGVRFREVLAVQAQAHGISEEAALAAFVEPAALQRVTQDTEIAAACAFLASDAAAAITGVDLNVAAGLVMY